jgi:hypothetical protein
MEAGHRCAIPRCQQVPVVIAHIKPWEQVKKHSFDNLIALCPTCHSRFDKGHIDRKAMRQYKANLSVLNGRYGDLERRVLRFFAKHPDANEIELPDGLDILLMYLLEDGLLVAGKGIGAKKIAGVRVAAYRLYHPTDKGRQFIEKWLGAETLE